MIYRNADYRNVCYDNKFKHYFGTCKIFVLWDLQRFFWLFILSFNAVADWGFYPNWAFGIAKVGSKTSPKSEV